jgi:PTH1 family peptidyl-tRNA hydrolase
MTEMRLIVGLGNPGKRYADTRHNIGFKVIDLLADALGVNIKKRKFGARFGVGRIGDKQLILLKPWRFVNLSGESVSEAMSFYKVDIGDLLVVVDDMALPVGKVRLRSRGTSGGHNGLEDIIEKLGSEGFCRCRVGIGAGGTTDAVDFVLSKPAAAERDGLDEAMDRARDAVLCWVEKGIEATMSEYN